MDTKERFLKKVKVVSTGCHEWQSTIHRDGYGKFWFNGKQEPAHRAAWVIFNGDIPSGLWVLHHCDNRKCVNPEHLYVGTPRDNTRDKIERCSWHGRMEYDYEDIQEIKRLYALGGVSQQALADKFGMCQTQVSRYLRGTQRATK